MERNARVWGELGDPLPNCDPHGVSVHLPTWEATMGYATKNPTLIGQMKTGYPRFFYHRFVEELGDRVRGMIEDTGLSTFNTSVSSPCFKAQVFPSVRSAYDLISYLEKQGKHLDPPPAVECYFLSTGPDDEQLRTEDLRTKPVDWTDFELAAVIYRNTDDLNILAKQFWMHTGAGLSSRYAEICLKSLKFQTFRKLPTSHEMVPSGASENDPAAGYILGDSQAIPWSAKARALELSEASLSLLKESIKLSDGMKAKATLKDRLADLNSSAALHISDDDVTLYQNGMSAITAMAGALKATAPSLVCPIVVFGFLYVDTFKTIERVQGWSTILHGQTSASELDELETSLKSGDRIAGLFLEFPGNPLLRSPDLARLRGLADKYHFPIIIDDTVGTPVNLDIMSMADVVASSLTKMFSGACNVMGGSLVLNPSLPFYDRLKASLEAECIDTYFPIDALVMCNNSTDFATRVHAASSNAATIAAQLRRSPAVTHVYYPKGGDTQALYDRFRRPDAGYGYLLSCEFTVPEAAVAFFDALETAKGPSLGTNFTLACPYTLYGHWGEREWAASYGVKEFLVRMSVGLEDEAVLVGRVEKALKAAETVLCETETR